MLSFKIIGLLVLEKIHKVFTIYGHGGYLGHMTRTIYKLLFPLPKDALHEILIGFYWLSCFRQDLLNCVRMDKDGQTTEHGYPIISPCEPNGSGELII